MYHQMVKGEDLKMRARWEDEGWSTGVSLHSVMDRRLGEPGRP